MPRLTRRSVLGIMAAGATGLLAACTGVSPAPPTTAPAAPEARTIEAITATSEKGYSIRVPAGWTPLKNVPGTDVAFVYQKIGSLRPRHRNETRRGAEEKAFHHLHLLNLQTEFL